MTFPKAAILSAIVLTATAACPAQQKFPLRAGEWTATTPDPTGKDTKPYTMVFCLNDETWAKVLAGNPTCSLQQLNIDATGGSYVLSCTGNAFQLKGNVKLTFDGVTHMTTTGSFDVTADGKTTHTDATTDYHWSGPTCSAADDVNLRAAPKQ